MRKNILRTFFAAALFCTLLTVSAWAETAVVTGDGVNMRSGPGTGYGIIACVDKGATVTVTDRSNSSWYSVTYNGSAGFMSSYYLNITDSGYGGVVSSSGSGYINSQYVNFRSGPATTYSVLGTYSTGKALTITGTSGDWTQCTIDGKSGYVYSKYINSGSYSGSGYIGNGNGYAGTVTATPTVTTVPVTTAAPTVTTVPVATATPAVTTVPVATATPAVTTVPVTTAAPTVTTVPTTSGTGGYINANYVRFRSGPSTGYSIINTYNYGQTLTIVGTSGSWTQCTINGTTGYVYSQYVTTSATVIATPTSTAAGTGSSVTKEGYITGNSVRFRSDASMSSSILGEFSYGDSVIITGTSGSWTAVTYNGKSGYVYSSYVAEGTYSYTSPSSSPVPTVSNPNGTATGADVAAFASQYAGLNYTWGGSSPSTGFDCSGLVYYSYQQFGYTLHRVAADQATDGVSVAASDIQPGDILCFYSGSSYIGHVGIYLGNDLFIHAANSEYGVIISQLSGWYASRGYEVRRIIT